MFWVALHFPGLAAGMLEPLAAWACQFTPRVALEPPREGPARRCGQGLIDELDRALGKLPEPREFFAPPERFAARLELPAEVTHAEALLFAARRLLVPLAGLLAARHAGVRAFTL